MLEGSAPDAAWDELDRYAAIVDQQIDLLVNYTAGDAFTYRQRARAAVAEDTQLNLFGTGLAVLLSALVAWLLARRIIGPVAAASAVAGRIAGGDLDGDIPRGSADELGALLAAMGVMRENIRAMMQREVAQRRSAQARLADALESSREGVVVVDAKAASRWPIRKPRISSASSPESAEARASSSPPSSPALAGRRDRAGAASATSCPRPARRAWPTAAGCG